MKIKKYGIYNCSDRALAISKHGNTNHDVVVVKKGLFHSKVKPISSLYTYDKQKDKFVRPHFNNIKNTMNDEAVAICNKAIGSKNFECIYKNKIKVKNSDLSKRLHHNNIKVLRKYRKHLA